MLTPLGGAQRAHRASMGTVYIPGDLAWTLDKPPEGGGPPGDRDDDYEFPWWSVVGCGHASLLTNLDIQWALQTFTKHRASPNIFSNKMCNRWFLVMPLEAVPCWIFGAARRGRFRHYAPPRPA